MAIKLTNKNQILDMSKIEEYLEKYEARAKEVTEKIADLTAKIEAEKVKRDELLMKDLTTAGDEYNVPLHESTAKLSNYQTMLNTELEKQSQLVNIMRTKYTEELLKDFYTKSLAEIAEYEDVEEKAIYTELKELTERQVELLKQLNNRRNEIENILMDFNAICEGLGYKQYKRTVSFHQNLLKRNSRFPELGNVMFHARSVSGAEYDYDMSKRVN